MAPAKRSAATFRLWRKEAGDAAFGQTYHGYLASYVGLSERIRLEIAAHVTRKAEVFGWEAYWAGDFDTQGDLVRWAIRTTRREARRHLPLLREINGWLWELPEDQRRILLLDYEWWGEDEISRALGVSAAEARQRLDDAKDALRQLIRRDGFDPLAWMDP
jgi:hypothetical protein